MSSSFRLFLGNLAYTQAASARSQCNCAKTGGGNCFRFNSWWQIVLKTRNVRIPGIYKPLVELLEYVTSLNDATAAEIESITNKKIKDISNVSLAELLIPTEILNAISLDVGRTCPTIPFFKNSGQRQIKRILMVYSLFDPQVGYVQGMNFLAANLLWHSNEEQAFWMLISIMILYDVRSMFLPLFPGVFRRSNILSSLLSCKLKDIHSHFESQGLDVHIMVSDWLMTLFAHSIPVEQLGCLWDSFFSLGWTAIYRIIIYRMNKLKHIILKLSDVADIIKIVKHGQVKTSFWSFTSELEDAYVHSTGDPNQECSEMWANAISSSKKSKLESWEVYSLEKEQNEYKDTLIFHKSRSLMIFSILSKNGKDNITQMLEQTLEKLQQLLEKLLAENLYQKHLKYLVEESNVNY